MNSLKALRTEFDICVLGNSNTGKSSLVLHFLYNSFIEPESSLEDLYIKDIRNGQIYNQISILDTASTIDSHSSSRKKQILNTSTIVYVYSVADYESYQGILELHDRILNIRNGLPPIVLVGTKCDLDDQRQVSYDEGVELAKNVNAIKFNECSTVRGFGIQETFTPLIDHLLLAKREKVRQESIISLSQIQKDLKMIPQTPLTFDEEENKFLQDENITVVPEESHRSYEKDKSKEPQRKSQEKSTKSKANNISLQRTRQTQNLKHFQKSQLGCCVIS